MSENNQEHDVVLWGPPLAGKTALLYAFGSMLNNCVSKNFIYEVRDRLEARITDFKKPGSIPATPAGEGSILWKIICKQNSTEESNKNKQDFLSVHYHQIRLYHFAGELLFLKEGGDPKKHVFSTPDSRHDVYDTFVKAKNIILVFDPTFVSDSSVYKNDSRGSYTKKEYFTNLRLFYDQLISVKPSIERNLAVCITKTDSLPNDDSSIPPETLLPRLFNAKDVDISGLIEKMRARNRLKIFSVSATRTGADRWEPYNVEAPFFLVI